MVIQQTLADKRYTLVKEFDNEDEANECLDSINQLIEISGERKESYCGIASGFETFDDFLKFQRTEDWVLMK